MNQLSYEILLTMEAFISYESVHGLAKQPVEELYKVTANFLNKHTTCGRPAIELTLHSLPLGKYKSWTILWKLMKEYGYFPTWDSWKLSEGKQHIWTWTLRGDKDVERAFKSLADLQVLENENGPLVLSFYWSVKFTDFRTRKILPHQDEIPIVDVRNPNPKIYLRLSRKSTISVWLPFPFESIDNNSVTIIRDIIKDLPFKVSDKHWRFWKKSKNNNWTPSKMGTPL